MAWLYLFAASHFEMAWIYSLRFMSEKKLKPLHWQCFFSERGGWTVIWPFYSYIVFGRANVWCISQAMKDIPASTCLAVWMGTALVGVKLVEILFLKGTYDMYQFLYIGLILVGIGGLKRNP